MYCYMRNKVGLNQQQVKGLAGGYMHDVQTSVCSELHTLSGGDMCMFGPVTQVLVLRLV